MHISLSGFFNEARTLINTHFFLPYCLLGEHFLENSETLVCKRCIESLATTEDGHRPHHWKPEDHHLSNVFSYWEFSESFRHLIHHMKYQYKPKLGYVLGRYAAHFLPEDYVRPNTYLIPVPLHRAKQRERGYNQSQYIARGIGRETQLPVLTDTLRRTRYTKTQTALNREERRKNMCDAFTFSASGELAAKWEDNTFLLVDDIFTTGATLESAAKTICQTINARIYGITLGTVPVNN